MLGGRCFDKVERHLSLGEPERGNLALLMLSPASGSMPFSAESIPGVLQSNRIVLAGKINSRLSSTPGVPGQVARYP